MARIARFATAAGIAAAAALVGIGATVIADGGPDQLPERVVTADTDASVRLGGATGHLRLPQASPHADAAECRAATSGCSRSGGNQSGGATEALPRGLSEQRPGALPVGIDDGSLPALWLFAALGGLGATSAVAHRARGFARVR